MYFFIFHCFSFEIAMITMGHHSDRKQIDCALHSAPESTSHSHVRFGQITGISSQFADKRPEKILIFVLNITMKTGMFTLFTDLEEIATCDCPQLPIKSGQVAATMAALW